MYLCVECVVGHPTGGLQDAVCVNAGGLVRSLSAQLQLFSLAKTSGTGQRSDYLSTAESRIILMIVF